MADVKRPRFDPVPVEAVLRDWRERLATIDDPEEVAREHHALILSALVCVGAFAPEPWCSITRAALGRSDPPSTV